MQVDSSAPGKSPSELQQEKHKIQKAIKLLREIGTPEDDLKGHIDKLANIDAQIEASDAQSVHGTSKLADRLKAAVQHEKSCQKQIDKWQSKLQELVQTQRETEAHLEAAQSLKADATAKVAEATKLMYDSVSNVDDKAAVDAAVDRKSQLDKLYGDLYTEQLRVWNASMENVLKNVPGITEEMRKVAFEKASQETTLSDKGRELFNTSIAGVILQPSGSASAKRPAEVPAEILSAEQQAEADAQRAEAKRIREAAEAQARGQLIK